MEAQIKLNEPSQRRDADNHLHGPLADGLLLGGASVIAFVVIRALDVHAATAALLGTAMMLLANVVNHPHFAFSYQIFYGSWREMRNGTMPRGLRLRWWLAGAIAPAALGAWLLLAALRWSIAGDGWWIAVSLNVMGALVGWHYVKQGFGMAMVDAAVKRKFWSTSVRRAMLGNAYACWFAAWAILNTSKGGSKYWGFFGLAIDVPSAVVAGLCVVAAGTTVWSTVSLTRGFATWRRDGMAWGQLPVNGVLAYAVTLYLWTVFSWADPTYALVIPFFHSLQYMTVVWRYKSNEAVTTVGHARRDNAMWRFAASGIVLGALGFWIAPGLADFTITGQFPMEMQQPAIALACAWIFINIHHYLIDSVLWRQGNPKVSRHLFSASAPNTPR